MTPKDKKSLTRLALWLLALLMAIIMILVILENKNLAENKHQPKKFGIEKTLNNP